MPAASKNPGATSAWSARKAAGQADHVPGGDAPRRARGQSHRHRGGLERVAAGWADYVSVYEDPEEKGVLVITGFDPQTWKEDDLARGTRVRLQGVNAVAGWIAVKMDGTQLERLAEAVPE